MRDWIGSLRIREFDGSRVVLGLSSSTQWVGWGLVALGLLLAVELWGISSWLVLVPGFFIGFGVLLISLRRDMVVDREAGTLVVRQRALGVGSNTVVPLFHLRAVVVEARPGAGGRPFPASKYVAYLERRVGSSIYLDEARRCAALLKIAEAIAEIAELRLEYDASSSLSVDDAS